MAEFDGLDSRLRDALGQAAVPGDSAGVADAIRSRVAAGDSGISVAGSTAPGWGGGVWSWLPWLGTVLLAGVVGTALGLSGVLGAPVQHVSVLQSAASVVSIAPAYACPGGAQVGQLRGGDRVVAVVRSEDAAYLGVRNPLDVRETLWLDSSAVIVDAGQPAVSTLPVGACPAVAIQYGDPEPTPEPEPVPVADTTPPTITQASGTPFFAANGQPSTITAAASDDRGVARVDIAAYLPSGASSSSGQMQNAGGGTWSYTYAPGSSPVGSYRFVLTAYDGAGNASAPVEIFVQGT